jgi:hypothetical protein
MKDPDKSIFVNEYFKQVMEKIAKLATLYSQNINGTSYRDEAFMLCMVYIDGLASLYYGEGNAKTFCKALSELSGNPLFSKLHSKTLVDAKFWQTAPKAKPDTLALIQSRPGELLDEQEVADIIRKSGLPERLANDLVGSLWRYSIAAICYEYMRTGAVHGFGTGTLTFGETIHEGKRGVSLDFKTLHGALEKIGAHVAAESIETGEWFGRPDFFKTA